MEKVVGLVGRIAETFEKNQSSRDIKYEIASVMDSYQIQKKRFRCLVF